MNILILYLGRKGAGPIYTYEMLCKLLEQGHDVSFLTSSLQENYEKIISLKEKFSNFSLMGIHTYSNKKEFILRTFNILNFYRMKKFIRINKPDWIYIPMLSAWASILIYFLSKKIKIVTTIHDVTQHLGEKNKFFNIIDTHLIKRSNKIITLTNNFIPIISKKYKKNTEDICCIEHANFNYYRPACFYNKKNITKKILFFGRIIEYKGISVLLDAMLLLKKENFEIKLQIVGSGSFSEVETTKIQELGDSVVVINRWIADEEMYHFFEDIDITIVPYIEASQSGVVMASYSFSKPVIVTNVGGLPAQVTEETGIIIPPNNSIILANKIKEMYANPEQLLIMGETAYKKTKTDYSWDISANKLVSFLKL